MEQYGFSVKANVKYAQAEAELDEGIENIVFTINNGSLVPTMTMTYMVNSKLVNMLVLPYTLELVITERNAQNEDRTVVRATFMSITNNASPVLREKDNTNRLDRIRVTHKFVLKDAYNLANTVVGGVYNNQNLTQIIKSLWGDTEHGRLQIKMGTLENKETYEQIWVPNVKFFRAVQYLSQTFGFYSMMPIMYADWENFYLMSVNEVKGEPIKLYLRDSGLENKKPYSIDKLEYCVGQMPAVSSNFNYLAANFPKKIDVLKHDTDKLYSVENINVVNELRSMQHVKDTDVYDTFLEKDVKPNNYIIAHNSNLLAFKESLSGILTHTVQPTNVDIRDPFRFNHWYIGRKVQIDPKHVTYAGMQTSFYISGLTFNIKHGNEKRWVGAISAMLQTASTRNIKA